MRPRPSSTSWAPMRWRRASPSAASWRAGASSASCGGRRWRRRCSSSTDFTRPAALQRPLRRPQDVFGVMGTDAATVFVSIGIIGFLLELAKEQRSRLNLFCAVPLLVSPFFAFQRRRAPSRSGPPWPCSWWWPLDRRRAGACGCAPAKWRSRPWPCGRGARRARSSPPSPRGRRSRTGGVHLREQDPGATFGSEGQAESAQSRLNKWTVALADAKLNPIIGQGLGLRVHVLHARAECVRHDRPDGEHPPRPVAPDRSPRSGAVPSWRFSPRSPTASPPGGLHPDHTVAVLTLALVAVVVGLVATGSGGVHLREIPARPPSSVCPSACSAAP